jgi:hypothetical protein
MNKRLIAAGAAASTIAVTGGAAAIAVTAGPAGAATPAAATSTTAPVIGSVSFNGFTLVLKGLSVVNGQAIASGALYVKVFGVQVGLGSATFPFAVQLDGSVAGGYSLITPPVTVKTIIGTVTVPKLKISIAGAGTPEAQLLSAASLAIHATEAAASLLATVLGTSFQAVEQQVYNAALQAMISEIGQLNNRILGHGVVAVTA